MWLKIRRLGPPFIPHRLSFMKRVVPPPSKKNKTSENRLHSSGGPNPVGRCRPTALPPSAGAKFSHRSAGSVPRPTCYRVSVDPRILPAIRRYDRMWKHATSLRDGTQSRGRSTSEAGGGTAPRPGRALGPAGRTGRRGPGRPPAPALRPRPGRGPPLAPKVWALAARKRHCKVFSPADGHTTAHIVEGCGYPAARLSVVSPPSCPIRYCLISSAKEPLPGQLSPPSVPHAMAAAQQPRAALLPGTRLPALPQSANTGSRCWQSQDFITTTLTSAGLFVISLLSWFWLYNHLPLIQFASVLLLTDFTLHINLPLACYCICSLFYY